jgi:curli biogenesis system outer membrane secretion channel CsgG
MKKTSLVTLALVTLLAACAPQVKPIAPPTVGPRLRVAVVEFENKTTYGQRLGTAAADILVTELAKTDRFILIERSKLDKLLAEQKLGMTGVVDPATAAQMGKVLGAAAIVTGAVSEFGVQTRSNDMLITESKKQIARAVVDVRIINTETSQILYAESGTGEVTSSTGTFLGLGSSGSYNESTEGEALRAAIQKFAGNLTNRLTSIPWTCRVAEVDGRTLYLDAGMRSGLNVGQVLDIVQLGDEIKSPSTGLVIGRKERLLGTARVSEQMGDDAAKADVEQGSTPAKGDLLRLPKVVPAAAQ